MKLSRIPRRLSKYKLPLLLTLVTVVATCAVSFSWQQYKRYGSNQDKTAETQAEEIHNTLQNAESADYTLAGEENPNAKPGEVGELLSHSPVKGKYIRGGYLTTTPTNITCYAGHSCTGLVTVSTSDGKQVEAILQDSSRSSVNIWATCGDNSCHSTVYRTSQKFRIDTERASIGTHKIFFTSRRYDPTGNTMIYEGSLGVTVVATPRSYVPPTYESPQQTTPPPYPLYTPPSHCEEDATVTTICHVD